jgi:hypothetical protein
MHKSLMLYINFLLIIVYLIGISNRANSDDNLKRVLMSADDLANSGIYVRVVDPKYHGPDDLYKKRRAGPNKCFYEPDRVLAVSDFMLKHFEERGFSLRALCLALQSTLRYDPGTGKQLPIAVAARRSRGGNSLEPIGSEILLNVPDCFRNGTPLIDCPRNFDASFGTKEDDPDRLRRDALDEDAKIRAFIRRGGYARVCGCSELRVQSWGELLLPDNCHLDTFPACARQIRTDPDPAGRLVKESATPLIVGLGLSSYYAAGVEISTSLPRGYGGSLGTEGGDPDTEDVTLETLRKESGSIMPWNQ